MGRLLLLLLLLLPAALASPRRREASALIVGGSAADVADFPWQLSLHYGGAFSCGASLLNQLWALTAARCVFEARVELLSLRGGTSYRDTGGVSRQVATGYVHRGWDPSTADYDVAVIRALSVFSYDAQLRPASLPGAGFEPPAGLAVTATGFGATGSGGALPIGLQRVDVAVAARPACAAALGPLTARMLCAGEPGRGFCSGDHGGPLVTADGVQVGAASWAADACEEAPAVYASVGSVREWLAEVTGA